MAQKHSFTDFDKFVEAIKGAVALQYKFDISTSKEIENSIQFSSHGRAVNVRRWTIVIHESEQNVEH